MKTTQLLDIAIEASIKAGIEIMNIYSNDYFEVKNKEDDSPLTKADLASNTIINTHLEKTGIPIISEENKQLSYEERKTWKISWIVDPLDGTKEFIKRNGEFTVNIALVENGVPILGVIYAPATRQIYYASTGDQIANKAIIDLNKDTGMWNLSEQQALLPSKTSKRLVRAVGSRSHMNKETEDFVSQLKEKYEQVEIVPKGSSLKFCIVADGGADIYPRFAPTMEWDTAAGHAICSASGINVISKDTGAELRYNKKSLVNSSFLVCRK